MSYSSNALKLAERKLEQVQNLFLKLGRWMAPAKLQALSERFVALSTEYTYSVCFPQDEVVEGKGKKADLIDGCVNLAKDAYDEANYARINQIRELVVLKVRRYQNSDLGDQFRLTRASEQAESWLFLEPVYGDEDVEVKVAEWVDWGWSLLKVHLEYPWGVCDCGNKLAPRLIVDSKTGLEKYVVFGRCYGCYISSRKVRTEENEAPIEPAKNRVKKPGSASRRKDAPKERK